MRGIIIAMHFLCVIFRISLLYGRIFPAMAGICKEMAFVMHAILPDLSIAF